MVRVDKPSRYKTYPDYKPSEVEWLGEIPKHWQICRLKHLAKIKNGQDYKSVESEEGYPVMGSGGQFTYASQYMFNSPSVLLGRKGTIDKPLYIDEPFWTVDTMYYTEMFPNVNAKYLFYLAKTIQFSRYSTNTALPSMTQEHLANFAFAAPKSSEERNAIASFLDYETAKIDTLIEKQQQLIKLLKEKRQAVISHAVTKGLNPDAPMKDSGVEWLGKVPKHWTDTKLKYVTHQIIDAEHKTAPYFDDGNYMVCRTTNVRDGKLKLEGAKFTNLITYKEWVNRGIPEQGDILFTREAPAGEACIYYGDIPLCLGQRMVLFKLNKCRVLPEYFLHSLYSGLADEFIKQLSQGSTVVHFNMSEIKNIPLFEPPISEQREIAAQLVKVLDKYDSLLYAAEKNIKLMQERRSSLISSAVTGKIDVRDWKPTDNKNTKEVEVTA